MLLTPDTEQNRPEGLPTPDALKEPKAKGSPSYERRKNVFTEAEARPVASKAQWV